MKDIVNIHQAHNSLTEFSTLLCFLIMYLLFYLFVLFLMIYFCYLYDALMFFSGQETISDLFKLRFILRNRPPVFLLLLLLLSPPLSLSRSSLVKSRLVVFYNSFPTSGPYLISLLFMTRSEKGVVMHKNSRWESQWKSFKETNPVVSGELVLTSH